MYSKISWGFDYIQPLVFFDNTLDNIPSGIYLLKVNERNTRARCEICSKLTIKIPERCQWLNFEHVSHLVLVFFLVTLSRQVPAGIFHYWLAQWGLELISYVLFLSCFLLLLIYASKTLKIFKLKRFFLMRKTSSMDIVINHLLAYLHTLVVKVVHQKHMYKT